MQCRERGERLLSYLALVEEIIVISELGSRLTGSRSNTKILPDVSQLGLQGENTKTERTKTVGLSLSSSKAVRTIEASTGLNWENFNEQISYLFFSKKLSSRINLRGCWDLELFLEVTHDQWLDWIFVCRECISESK